MDRIIDGNEKLIDYIQRLAGLGATADATVQELFIFYGGGTNRQKCSIRFCQFGPSGREGDGALSRR